MSSCSIARQNRRKRLKQNPYIPRNGESSTISDAAMGSELTSEDRIGNSESASKAYSDGANCDSANVKVAYSSESEPYEALSFATNCSFITRDVSSRPVEKIFIEGERGFHEINPSEIFHISHNEISIQSDQKNELIHVAFETAKYFHSLSNFCHGLLGGMSLLYIFVLLHLFSDLSVDAETIKYFSFFSKPVHNLFNFLCIICCISTFDRCDISNTEGLFKLIRKLDFKLITLFLYPVCLLLSLSTANVDDKLCISEKNVTIWESLNFKEEEYELYCWKTLSISKCFGALLAWIILCWDQNFNLFLDHLRSILHRRKISLH